jgi:chromosome segregation ATPase
MSSLFRKLAGGFAEQPASSPAALPRAKPADTAPAAAPVPADQDVGRSNEALRSQIESLSHNFAIVDDIRTSLDHFRSALGTALDELENTRSALKSVEASLRVERLASAELRKELTTVKAAHQAVIVERDRQAAWLADAARSISDLEATIVTLETDLDVKNQYGVLLQNKLDHVSAEAAEAVRDNQILTTRLTEADQRLARAETELTRVQADKIQVEADLRAMKTSLDSALTKNQEASRALLAREAELAEHKKDNTRLRSDILRAEADLRRAIAEAAEWRQKAETDAAAAQIKIDAVAARADLSQRLLAEARQTFKDRSDELRTLERTLADTAQRAIAAEARAQRAEDARQKLEDQLAATESARVTQLDRAEALAKALKTKEAAALLAEEAASDIALGRQRDAEAYEREIASLKTRIAELLRDFEREQGDRQIAEGALATARRDRLQLQQELLALKRARRAVDPDAIAPVNDAVPAPEEPAPRQPFASRSA